MKVLVTGHRGYIGVEMVPVLRAAGHEVVGLDTGLLRRVRFPAPPDEVPTLDVDLRDVTPAHLEGLRRGHAPGGAVQRSARRPQPATSPTTSTCTRRCAWPRREGGRRAAVPVLVVVQPVRRRAATAARRERGVQSGHRLRRIEGAGRAGGRRSWPTTSSRRSTCATPPPTASRAGCAPTSWSTTSWATPSRPARCCCRATARRGVRWCTSRDIIHAFECCLDRAQGRHPQPGVQRRAHRARTSASARSPTWSPRSSRTARSTFAPGASRRHAQLPGRLHARSRPSCRATRRQWTLRKGIEELYQAYKSAGLTKERVLGSSLLPPAHGERLAGAQVARRPAEARENLSSDRFRAF